MAEIKIEKKKPIWPWILLLVIILAIVAYFVLENNNYDNDYQDDVNSETIDDVDDYDRNDRNDSLMYDSENLKRNSNDAMMEYNEAIRDFARIGSDSVYTKTAFYKLANGIVEKADEFDLERSTALESLRTYSDSSNNVRNEGIMTNIESRSENMVTVLKSIQTKEFPGLQDRVMELKEVSNTLQSTTPFKNQQSNFQRFFRSASELLMEMN